MNFIIFIIIAVVYAIGVWTVIQIDKVLPEDFKDPKNHFIILFLMWIFTPILILMFIGYYLRGILTKVEDTN